MRADEAKVEHVRNLIAALPDSATLVGPAEVLGELFVVLRRRGMKPAMAREILFDCADAFEVPSSEQRAIVVAIDLAVDHRLQFRDALILFTAAEARCQILLSEGMQHGFVGRGLTMASPFATLPHSKLAVLPERGSQA